VLHYPTRRSQWMVAVHWNPHWECFFNNAPKCAGPAMEAATNMIVGNSVDFAGFIELESDTYPDTLPDPYVSIGGNVCTEFYGDWAQIVYDSSLWHPVGMSSKGCFPASNRSEDARAYIVQAFQSRTSDFNVTVISAHMPHPFYQDTAISLTPRYVLALRTLKEAIGAAQNVVFLSDTNGNLPGQNGGLSNQLLYDGLGLGPSHPPVESELFNSCCESYFYPQASPLFENATNLPTTTWAADRIFASFGSDARTTFPLKSGPFPHHGPEFMGNNETDSSAHLRSCCPFCSLLASETYLKTYLGGLSLVISLQDNANLTLLMPLFFSPALSQPTAGSVGV